MSTSHPNLEESYRTLFNTMDEGFALCELVRDHHGGVIDYRILDANPSFAAHAGFTIDEVVGRLRSEIYPTAGEGPSGAEVLAVCARVVATRAPARLEQYSAARDRWLNVGLFPHRGDQFTALFGDITERKRHEDRQAFLLELSDGLSPLGDPGEVQAVAARILGKHLGVTRVAYGEVSADGADLLVARSYVVGHAPELTGRYRMADFGAALIADLRAGRTVAVPDVSAAPELSAAERAAYAAYGIAALAGVPLVKHGRFVANLNVQNVTPRAWSAGDLALIEETAQRTWAAVERARAEAALRASRATLQTFYDTAPFMMGIGEIDGDNLVAVSANRRTAEFFARSADAIPGHAGLELGTPAAIEAFWLAQLRKSQQEGVPVHFEYQDVRAAGTAWLSVTVAIIGTGPSGRPQYSFIAEDITGRTQTEAALRESESRLQAIANLVPDLLWSNDAVGSTDWYNQRWLEYTGQSAAEALGEGWLAAIHPQDRESSLLRFRAAAERGEPLRHEHRLRSAGGDYRWHLIQMRPVRDVGGNIIRWFGAATDIHEQRVALEALRTSEELFRTLTNAVPQVIWANDALGRAIYYNQRWYDYTGLDFAACAGFGWQVAVHPGDVATAVTRWQKAIAGGEMFEFEYRLRRHDHVYRWHLCRVVPFKDEHGEVSGWFGSSTDIEDLKQAEVALQAAYSDLDRRVQERTAELRELSQVRQELLQRLVTIQEDERRRIARELHDSLGQFLSALSLRLSILEQTAGVASSVLEEIEQLRPAVQLIDRELDRMTMELRPPALDDFGLPAAIHNYAASWARLANIRVDVYVVGLDAPSAALPPSAQLGAQSGAQPVVQPGAQAGPRLAPEVETSVYRIVQEALNNVLKHAEATAVSVIVERRRAGLNIIVEDNGIGFDPDALDGILDGEPGVPGTVRRHLGLLGMQERAALAGGTVQIESAPGAGTTIYVHIPYQA